MRNNKNSNNNNNNNNNDSNNSNSNNSNNSDSSKKKKKKSGACEARSKPRARLETQAVTLRWAPCGLGRRRGLGGRLLAPWLAR